MRVVLPLLAVACYGPGVEPAEQLTLADSYGDVRGSLAIDGETVSFASGVAYGNSFFHGGDNVLVFTEWGGSQCDGDGPVDWEATEAGYALDVAFDDEGGVEEEQSTLWLCGSTNGRMVCEGVAYPDLDLSFTALKLETGELATGTVEVSKDGVEGSLDFAVTYCGAG